MDYKYKKGQIFGKRLKVPKYIRNKVYNSSLSLEEMIEFNLDDKIPPSCLKEEDRKLVEKFGMEKIRTLDRKLITNQLRYNGLDFKELLEDVDSSVEDINLSLYEKIKDSISPDNYSPRMKEVYSDRLFDMSEDIDREIVPKQIMFNAGRVSLGEIISSWDLYRGKDLSYCLLKDYQNRVGITSDEVKEVMNSYQEIIDFLMKYGAINDLYTFIHSLHTIEIETERKEYIKQFTDIILEEAFKERVQLSKEDYIEIFKYSALEDYLKRFDQDGTSKLMEELSLLGQDYIFQLPINFESFCNSLVLQNIGRFGLQNVVEFDQECGNFLLKDGCKNFKQLDYMFFNNGESISRYHDRIFIEDGIYNPRRYTKEEFYEVMRRMITYRFSYGNDLLDYRELGGKFQAQNSNLYLREDAPEELKNYFYTKSITPQLLSLHPEFVPFLKDKKLVSCFKSKDIMIDNRYVSFYEFFEEKLGFDTFMNFVMDYGDILEVVLTGEFSNLLTIQFSENDHLEDLQSKLNEGFKKLAFDKRIVYPKNIPQSLKENFPSLFLREDAPKELKERFYNRTIDSDFISSNPLYREYLKDVDLELIFPSIQTKFLIENGRGVEIDFVRAIERMYGKEEAFQIMMLYGKYLESALSFSMLSQFSFDYRFTEEDLLKRLDSLVEKLIIEKGIKYDENAPKHFQENYPSFFLNSNVPEDIRKRFYNRELTINDFLSNPNLLEILGDTNVVCGFSEKLSWMISLFQNFNSQEANWKRLKVLEAYSKIQDFSLQNIFKEYVMDFKNDIDVEKIDFLSEILSRLSLSNSSEIFTFRKELATQILKSGNPLESLNKIEAIFLRNNIPVVGKVYSCFEILHPEFQGFNFDESSMVSPVLKNSSMMRRKVIVFSDLIKASFGSNNRSLQAYLNNIEIGSDLYESIRNGKRNYETLTEEEKREIFIFSKHLETLYNNTLKGKKEENGFVLSNDVLKNIQELSILLSPNGSEDYYLADRVIRMFCGFAGINTLEQAKYYMNQKVMGADARNRKTASSDMVLEPGDFLKGIGDIKYLRNILQNGSVSKEFLGASAGSDATPLDTDISMLGGEGTIREKMDRTEAAGYGNIWFVLKNDDRFSVTRNLSGTVEKPNDLSKLEVFYTGKVGSTHYGIRTGFASSEIDYIVVENYDPRVGLEIAMNGFYIPVSNKEGEIVFTPDDYDKMRSKMSGLSYFGEDRYLFSNNLITEETEYFANLIEQSNYEVEAKRNRINERIKQSLEKVGLKLKTTIDGDLTEGFVELIDTGSTGRGTNKPGDGDFDFMMRLDKSILANPAKLSELKQTILREFGKEASNEITGNGDFRLKEVSLGGDISVDIDITFTEKTDKVSYSTDMSLRDRLETVQKNNSEKYRYVVANILLAKKVLKEAGVYKPNRGEIPQGGLGGVGIENWILQNGGSFIDAATSFIEASEEKSFQEFQSIYQIWDFGDNHLAEKRGHYPHDNFVTNNMSEEGFKRMREALKEYLKNIQMVKEESIQR